jgi:hypothetical protein
MTHFFPLVSLSNDRLIFPAHAVTYVRGMDQSHSPAIASAALTPPLFFPPTPSPTPNFFPTLPTTPSQTFVHSSRILIHFSAPARPAPLKNSLLPVATSSNAVFKISTHLPFSCKLVNFAPPCDQTSCGINNLRLR